VSFFPSPLSFIAILCALGSAGILGFYLVRRPKLNHATKVWLLFGLGVFPIGVAATGNLEGFEATKRREFCGSCHVMEMHGADSNDPTSQSLASRHGRNQLFGSENCYACHADYGMFGTVVTKLGGMRHVWIYYTEYRNTSLAEAQRTIKLRKPFPNDNCMQCHSTKDEIWLEQSDHRAALVDVREGHVSCASGGCHGSAHPFFGPDKTPTPARKDGR
jgi:cytochrome c-type protein NapC